MDEEQPFMEEDMDEEEQSQRRTYRADHFVDTAEVEGDDEEDDEEEDEDDDRDIEGLIAQGDEVEGDDLDAAEYRRLDSKRRKAAEQERPRDDAQKTKRPRLSRLIEGDAEEIARSYEERDRIAREAPTVVRARGVQKPMKTDPKIFRLYVRSLDQGFVQSLLATIHTAAINRATSSDPTHPPLRILSAYIMPGTPEIFIEAWTKDDVVRMINEVGYSSGFFSATPPNLPRGSRSGQPRKIIPRVVDVNDVPITLQGRQDVDLQAPRAKPMTEVTRPALSKGDRVVCLADDGTASMVEGTVKAVDESEVVVDCQLRDPTSGETVPMGVVVYTLDRVTKTFDIGQSVSIVAGPFRDKDGTVTALHDGGLGLTVLIDGTGSTARVKVGDVSAAKMAPATRGEAGHGVFDLVHFGINNDQVGIVTDLKGSELAVIDINDRPHLVRAAQVTRSVRNTRLAEVPDSEQAIIQAGDKVRVIKGPYINRSGIVEQIFGKTCFIKWGDDIARVGQTVAAVQSHLTKSMTRSTAARPDEMVERTIRMGRSDTRMKGQVVTIKFNFFGDDALRRKWRSKHHLKGKRARVLQVTRDHMFQVELLEAGPNYRQTVVYVPRDFCVTDGAIRDQYGDGDEGYGYGVTSRPDQTDTATGAREAMTPMTARFGLTPGSAAMDSRWMEMLEGDEEAEDDGVVDPDAWGADGDEEGDGDEMEHGEDGW